MTPRYHKQKQKGPNWGILKYYRIWYFESSKSNDSKSLRSIAFNVWNHNLKIDIGCKVHIFQISTIFGTNIGSSYSQ